MKVRTQEPMPLAEAAECCGQVRWNAAGEDRGTGFDTYCENCPLLIERQRERVLQAARAM